MHKVEFTQYALKDLKKFDKQTVALILVWIRKNLGGCENLRQHDKSPTTNRNGEWRYRVENYRILVEIKIML